MNCTPRVQSKLMTMKLESAVFGGGCFWCTEAVFSRLKGVNSVTSGYAGGNLKNPSYHEIIDKETGHAEVIKIEFDPSLIAYETLLDVFFSSHNPTSLNRQGNDIGNQYRSVIFSTNENQRSKALKYIKKLDHSKVFDRPVVTEVKTMLTFYPAEDYHQKYYERNIDQPYCEFVISPKLKHLKERFAHLLK